jgi:cytochrome c oxidase cbb3-type subunit 1
MLGAGFALIPVVAIAVNLVQTLSGQLARARENLPLQFILFGLVAWFISGLLGALTSLPAVSEVTQFTWFLPAQRQLAVYGFFTMTMFGAIYCIVPRLLQMEFPSAGKIRLHFWVAALGVVLYVVPLAIGGLQQGAALNDPKTPFLDVAKGTLLFLRGSTTGDLLIAFGHLIFFLNLFGMVLRFGRSSFKAIMISRTKPMEVAT